MKPVFKFLFFIILFFSLTSLIVNDDGNDYFVYLNGKKQHVLVEGVGEPTVIFLSGKGRMYTDFKKVYNVIKKSNKIVAYDRAGIGTSEYLRNTRTVDTMAFELNELLVKENIKPPYILVGHSMGTYIARCFTSMYPQKVTGLIFVEPANEQEYAYGLSIRNDSDKIVFKEQLKSFLHTKGATKGQRAESKYSFDIDSLGFSTNQQIVKDLKIPTNLPITIILSKQTDVDNDYIDKETKFKIDFFENWKIQNANTKIITTSKSGYFIQKEEPKLIVNEIKNMIEKLK